MPMNSNKNKNIENNKETHPGGSEEGFQPV
jgi:hypothetical protein